jgi:tRNA-2-methylthio-N6-dimethylallyladenosine synthase
LIVNTCSVREKAEQKAMSTLGRMSRLKRRGRARILVMMGCVAQQEGEVLLKRFPELDLVIGAREAPRTGALVAKTMETGERVAAVDIDHPPMTAPAQGAEEYLKGRVKGFITIMQGCDNFCSYCIVPYVRGREASRSPADILEEAEGLVAGGVKEITLLGQNVNSYRWDQGAGGVDFAGLIRMMAEEFKGRLLRLRFTTSHPKDLTTGLIECFRELEVLCPHIHLPFQAGSDRILRLMNRRYTRTHYMQLVAALREARPGIAITSDVMVGFPGETHEDFLDTLELIEKVRFDNLYSFKYSDRKGTAAAEMKEKVPEEEKRRRLSELQALQNSITMKKNQALVGSETEVLVEGRSKKGGDLSGRTPTNYVVNFPGPGDLVGRLVRVVVREAKAHSLYAEAGKIVSEPCVQGSEG